MVETYASRRDAESFAPEERFRAAAEEVSDGGNPVRFLRRILVPEDETCLLLYEAKSADDAAEAARRAGIEVERVVEAVEEGSALREAGS
jgi:hypothetical protein